MTNASISIPNMAKARKRKRLSTDAGEPSATESNGASISNGKSTDNGEGTSSSAPQVRTATVVPQSGSETPLRGEVKEDGKEETSRHNWRSRAITEAKKMPKDMTKYWYSRYRLFSRFDEGVLMDAQSWFSVTPEVIAARIASRCLYPLLPLEEEQQQQQQQTQSQRRLDKGKEREIVILDLFCGAGGNAIQFALAGMEEEGQQLERPTTRVIAVDIDPDKIEYARHNARIYGVEERIQFLVGDAVEFVKDWKKAKAERDAPGKETTSKKKRKKKTQKANASMSRWEGEENTAIDVVFLSPPWGGVDYQNAGMPPAVPAPALASPLLDGIDDDQSAVQLEGAASASAPLDEAITSASASLAASLPTSFSTPQLIREQALLPSSLPTGGPSTLLAGSELQGEQDRKQYAYYPLSSLLPLAGQELYDLARSITPNVALYLPRNCDLWEIAKLTGKGTSSGEEGGREREQDLIAVEEQFLGSGLKALAVYCGALASGWEE